MNLWKSLFSARYLWVTNTVSCGVLLAAGDAIQQHIRFFNSSRERDARKREILGTGCDSKGLIKGKLIPGGLVSDYQKWEYDYPRTWRMFLVGLSQGPPHHIWYTWLDKVIKGNSLKNVGKKILADQAIAAPFFAITFFLGMGFLEYKSLTEILEEFRKKFPAVYLFDWCIWPPTQFVNFMYVPAAYRVLYVNVVTVLWDVFLSYIKHYDQITHIDFEDFEAFSGKNLVVANTLGTGVLFAIGDMGVQGAKMAMSEKEAWMTFDLLRSGRMFIVGCTMGPALHYYYVWLDKLFPRKNVRSVLKMIIVEELAAAPAFAAGFIALSGVFERHRAETIAKEVSEKVPRVYLTDLCFWPPIQYVNFLFIPERYRVLYVNVFSCFWNGFLSFVKHEENGSEPFDSSHG